MGRLSFYFSFKVPDWCWLPSSALGKVSLRSGVNIGVRPTILSFAITFIVSSTAPVPKSRPEAQIHVEPDDDVLLENDPIVYRPCLNYADSVPNGGLKEVECPLSQNTPSHDNTLSKSPRENRSSSKVLDSTPRLSEGLSTSENEWILGEHCWINPRGIWSTSAGRGMPEKNLILYETRHWALLWRLDYRLKRASEDTYPCNYYCCGLLNIAVAVQI